MKGKESNHLLIFLVDFDLINLMQTLGKMDLYSYLVAFPRKPFYFGITKMQTTGNDRKNKLPNDKDTRGYTWHLE